MKKNYKYFLGLLLISSVFACKKDLDINDNPNAPVEATVRTVLPQALTATANNMSQFNNYGAQVVGYYANGGGVSGWGSIVSYNYQTSEFNGLWSTTYDILTDVKYVLDKSEGDATLTEFNAAAKVLKAYNFQLLVDTYNDVPYTEANQGLGTLLPKYDKGTDIYKSLADLCDEAIASFKTVTTATPAFKIADPLFGGDAKRWAQFANTLKLKLVLKGKGKVQFSNTTFDAAVGFITADASVQPGYTKIEGKQNPAWNRWAYSASGAAVSAASQYAVTPWIMSFYDDTKIYDPARANVVFKSGVSTAVNQLGYQLSDAGRGATPSSWFRGSNASTYDKIGILKGPDAAQPIMLAAESYFLQAEASLDGTLPAGSAKTAYLSGIEASFRYLYLNNAGTVTAGKDPVADAATYQADNVENPLVNFDLAVTDAQKLEAIITQKYIAFNMLFGHEAWNEFRRTGYPSIRTSGADETESFVSIVSESSAPNKLPTRLPYPLSEYKYNAGNIPDADKYTSKIFWAK